MLKGKKINLSFVEKPDLRLLWDWSNDVDFNGEFEPFHQESFTHTEKAYEKMVEGKESGWFFIQKKDGKKVGYIVHFKSKDCLGIGYMLLQKERGKGYGTEAVQMMVDYLFLHMELPRIQAETHPFNMASQRVLEKAGFKMEGIIRQSFFSRGVHRDTAMWSILRDEWKRPRILPLGHENKSKK